MPSQITESDLHRELADLKEHYPRLKPDELFVLWFLIAFVTEDEKQAAEALCGGSGDKSLDAVLVDDDAKMVFIIQGKYRKQIGTKAEARNDVLEFARLGPLLAASQTEFQARARTYCLPTTWTVSRRRCHRSTWRSTGIFSSDTTNIQTSSPGSSPCRTTRWPRCMSELALAPSRETFEGFLAILRSIETWRQPFRANRNSSGTTTTV